MQLPAPTTTATASHPRQLESISSPPLPSGGGRSIGMERAGHECNDQGVRNTTDMAVYLGTRGNIRSGMNVGKSEGGGEWGESNNAGVKIYTVESPLLGLGRCYKMDWIVNGISKLSGNYYTGGVDNGGTENTANEPNPESVADMSTLGIRFGGTDWLSVLIIDDNEWDTADDGFMVSNLGCVVVVRNRTVYYLQFD